MPATQPTLIDRLLAIERRLAEIEANVAGPPTVAATANRVCALDASAKGPFSITGDADTLDTHHWADVPAAAKRTIFGYAYSDTNHTIDSAGETYHTDALAPVTITLAATSTVYVIATVLWQQASGTGQCRLRAIETGTPAYGDVSADALDDPSGYLVSTVVIGAFASQSAGEHTYDIQAARVATSANLQIKWRQIVVVGVED